MGGGEANGRISSQESGKQVLSSFTKSYLPIFHSSISSTAVQKLNNSSLMNKALLFLDLSNVMYIYIIANTVFSVLLAPCVKMELHGYFFVPQQNLFNFHGLKQNQTNNTENGNHAPCQVSLCA